MSFKIGLFFSSSPLPFPSPSRSPSCPTQGHWCCSIQDTCPEEARPTAENKDSTSSLDLSMSIKYTWKQWKKVLLEAWKLSSPLQSSAQDRGKHAFPVSIQIPSSDIHRGWNIYVSHSVSFLVFSHDDVPSVAMCFQWQTSSSKTIHYYMCSFGETENRHNQINESERRHNSYVFNCDKFFYKFQRWILP